MHTYAQCTWSSFGTIHVCGPTKPDGSRRCSQVSPQVIQAFAQTCRALPLFWGFKHDLKKQTHEKTTSRHQIKSERFINLKILKTRQRSSTTWHVFGNLQDCSTLDSGVHSFPWPSLSSLTPQGLVRGSPNCFRHGGSLRKSLPPWSPVGPMVQTS